MFYLLQHSTLFALLAAACWLAGVLLEQTPFAPLRWEGADGVDDPLRQLRRWCLGLGLWIACVFLLTAAGWLARSSVLAVLGGLAVAGAWAWLRGRKPRRAPIRLTPAHLLLAVVGVITILPLYLLALTPVVSWDASAYHLTLPKLFLAHGGFRPVAMNIYSNWPLNVELLFAVAMAVLDHVLAKVVHFGFGLLTIYAMWAGCRRFHRPASGWLAMPLLLANGVVVSNIRVAYVDLAYAFFFVAGFLFMIEALDREPRALWLAGVCCGLAAGVKITGIVAAGAVGALYLPRLARGLRRGESAPLRPFVTGFVLPILVLWTPWLARTAWLTGNPFYPLLHGWFGGPDWSPALGAKLQAWQSSIGMGREPIDYLLLPLRVILAGGEGYQRFDGEVAAFWLALVPLCLWAAPRLALVRRCLAVSGLIFVFWSLSSQQMRFLIPALPPLAIAAAVALVELLDRIPKRRWRRGLGGLAFAAAAAFLVVSQGRVLAAGYRTLGVYLRAEGDLLATARRPVWDFIETSLPPGARLLFLNTNQGFFCDREYLADSFFEASQIADWLSPAADVAAMDRLLTERGISHVLLEHRPSGAAYPAILAELLRDPAAATLVYRSEDGRYSLYERAARP